MPAPAAPPAELAFTDVVLRAEADGSTARAHRNILAAHSGVFREALAADVAAPLGVLPLPGKREADVQLLLGFLYPEDARSERFTLHNISAVLSLGREYDMPGMARVAERWLIACAAMGSPLVSDACLSFRGNTLQNRTALRAQRADQARDRVRLLRLAHEYRLDAFAAACAKQLCELSCADLRDVMTQAQRAAEGGEEQLRRERDFLHALVLQMLDTRYK
jgi:hypothetical protein